MEDTVRVTRRIIQKWLNIYIYMKKILLCRRYCINDIKIIKLKIFIRLDQIFYEEEILIIIVLEDIQK